MERGKGAFGVEILQKPQTISGISERAPPRDLLECSPLPDAMIPGLMVINAILQNLRAERTQIDHAIAALEALTKPLAPRRPGRSVLVRRRTLSAAARARIAAAQRKRWRLWKAKQR